MAQSAFGKAQGLKTRIVDAEDHDELEKWINEALDEIGHHEVVEIRYTCQVHHLGAGTVSHYTAMIIYKK